MDIREPEGRKELGRRIQSAVIEAGYRSLAAFAEQLDCSRALIYQYVNGDVLVQLDRLQTIAELTGKSLGWFISDEPDARAGEVAELERRLGDAEGRARQLEQALANGQGERLQQAEQQRQTVMGLTRDLCLAHRAAGNAQNMLDVAPRWLALAQECGDGQAVMAARLQMAHAWYQTGDLERAKVALAEVLDRAESLGDVRAQQSAEQELVRVLQACGRVDEASEHAEHLAASDRWWPRWSGRSSLAALAEQVGDLGGAEKWLGEAEAVVEDESATKSHQPLARAYIASNRVNLIMARGHYREALAANEAFQELAGRAGLPDQMREAALNAAICHLRLREAAEAADHLGRLAEWAAVSGDRRLASLTKVFESQMHRVAGDVATAKRLAREAADEATEARRGHLLAEAELALGRAYWAEGRADDARYYLERCRGRAERLRLRKLGVEAEFALARVASAEGELDSRARLEAVGEMAATLGYEDICNDVAEALQNRDK